MNTEIHRAPNLIGSAATLTPTETDVLLEELAYSPLFRTFINAVIVPKVLDIREKLLRDASVDDKERARLQGQLMLVEAIFTDLYGHTEAGVLPEALAKFFL